MNKLDFMSLGKKAVLSYIYSKYGYLLSIRDFGMMTYTLDRNRQQGKYRVEPWAHCEPMEKSIFQVDYDPITKVFTVSEWTVKDQVSYTGSYILATVQTVDDKLRNKTN